MIDAGCGPERVERHLGAAQSSQLLASLHPRLEGGGIRGQEEDELMLRVLYILSPGPQSTICFTEW
jgi:hypothetical protein